MTDLTMKNATKFFLDRREILDRIGEENAKILKQWGYDTRDTARKLIKKPKQKTQTTKNK